MKKLRLTVVLCVVLALLAVGLYVSAGQTDDMVEIDAAGIEDSTLIIGTHLIHLSALTQPIHEIAEASAGESGQMRIYYKSELAGGAWFDITEATTLVDITTGGSPVQNGEIEGLPLTHHTRSDGITYDLRTGQPVSLGDINDPYDLEGLEELFPMKIHYDLVVETRRDSKAGKRAIALIEQVFATEVRNEATNGYDAALEALQTYYRSLAGRDGDAERMGAVQEVIAAVDAARRAQVMAKLETVLNERVEELQRSSENEDNDGEAAQDTSLQAAVNDSLQNVSSSLITYEGRMLSEGVTVLSGLRYAYSSSLISNAEAGNSSACDGDVENLLHIGNILGGAVVSRTAELGLLQEEILPEAAGRYRSGIAAGVSAEYREAAGAGDAVLSGIADANAGQVNVLRSELEFCIDALCLRMENSDARSLIGGMLVEANGYGSTIPGDDFRQGAQSSVDAHIRYLSDKARELELAAGGNEVDRLMAEKNSLQSAYMAALDDNDLALAKRLQGELDAVGEAIQAEQDAQLAAIEDLQERIDELESRLGAGAPGGDISDADGNEGGTSDSGATALERELAELRGELDTLRAGQSDGSLGDLVSGLKEECLMIIGGSTELEFSRLSRNIDTLAGMLDMNYKFVFPVLLEIHEAMAAERDIRGSTLYDTPIEAVEESILNNAAAYAAALSGAKSGDVLEGLRDSFFGEDGHGLDADGQAVVYILALRRYFQVTAAGEVEALMNSEARRQQALGNPLVFETINDGAGEYLTARAAAHCTGMRYVWNGALSKATLALGGQYYEFSVYSDRVLRDRESGESDSMSAPVNFQAVPYLPESYTLQEFGVEAVYIGGTGLGAAVTGEMADRAEELLALFLQ